MITIVVIPVLTNWILVLGWLIILQVWENCEPRAVLEKLFENV